MAVFWICSSSCFHQMLRFMSLWERRAASLDQLFCRALLMPSWVFSAGNSGSCWDRGWGRQIAHSGAKKTAQIGRPGRCRDRGWGCLVEQFWLTLPSGAGFRGGVPPLLFRLEILPKWPGRDDPWVPCQKLFLGIFDPPPPSRPAVFIAPHPDLESPSRAAPRRAPRSRTCASDVCASRPGSVTSNSSTPQGAGTGGGGEYSCSQM